MPSQHVLTASLTYKNRAPENRCAPMEASSIGEKEYLYLSKTCRFGEYELCQLVLCQLDTNLESFCQRKPQLKKYPTRLAYRLD